MIGSLAFEGCKSLLRILIPKSCIEIQMGAFYASNIREIYIAGNIKINTYQGYYKNGYSSTQGIAYYYSENKPTEKGKYWHYVDGEIVIWNSVEG